MFNKQNLGAGQVTFHRYEGKGYSIFRSLSINVRIGVLTVATLATAVSEKMHAQEITTPQRTEQQDAKEMEEVGVTGTMAPLTQLQSARMVSVISRSDIQRAGVQSVTDLLKLATGVDVRQRGGWGVQADISIDGGTFDQCTLLLNGVNISNPHTGHLAMDIPVNINDIERIEILEGAASRVYGGSSFGGAINIVTRTPHSVTDRSTWSGYLGAEGGQYGTVTTEARISNQYHGLYNSVSGGWGRSDGGTQNSDWNKSNVYYQGGYKSDSQQGTAVNWQFGYSQKDYGANTFYSAAYPNQYERNDRILLSVGAQTGGLLHLSPSVYWNRTYDNFELVKGSTFGENFHISDVYGLKLGGYLDWKAGKTAFAAEIRHEGILSTSLGKDLDPTEYVPVGGEDNINYTRRDSRTNINFNVEHNVILDRWTLSAGVLAHTSSGVDNKFRFCPGLDISYRPATGWKMYLSFNMGYRLPSFTELYYKSPTHDGNKGLKPEESHSVQLGTQYYRQGVSVTARAFYHHGRNMIDWVMYDAQDQFHSACFQLDNFGVQVQGKLDFQQLSGHDTWVKSVDAGYTWMHQWRMDDIAIYKSNYAMEYLRHKMVANLTHRIWDKMEMTWSLRVQDRNGAYILYQDAVNTGQLVDYKPYATLDVKLQWTDARYQVWVKGTNITNTHYYDLGNIPQPGAWVMAGARWCF